MAKKARKPGVAEFVLDGSLALAWYFKDEADAVAARFPATSDRACDLALGDSERRTDG